MKPILYLPLIAFLLWLCFMAFGCTVVSNNRVFPKLTWSWSAEAKQQRAEREQYKKEFPKPAP